MSLSSFFRSPVLVFTTSIIFRAVFLMYGLWQDANSPMKYTDIDYYVFTDAARYISRSQPPYARDTYRYTPLLAWLIYPTVWTGKFWFSSGKVLFAIGDVATGWMMFRILKEHKKMTDERALKFASIWLLNPMVATISTRGSSEGLLGVFVTALLWAVLAKQIPLAGFLLGFAVHFKIYPIIYAVSIVLFLDETQFNTAGEANSQSQSLIGQIKAFLNPSRLMLAFYSLLTFASLNLLMYSIYGWPFLEHSYLYHLIRSDHRHNFSPYSTILYLSSSPKPSGLHSAPPSFGLERLAFLPQLLLSAVFIPLALSKKDLPDTMLAQTFAFVTFNKVCTSQYFLWYMMFLPYYLPQSTLLQSPSIGVFALLSWIAGQAAWLFQGFQLEFNGNSTFVPALWIATILFFIINVGILSVIINDTKQKPVQAVVSQKKKL
ncbi:GPI mannosyltransferase 1 [Exserohilum turcicum]|uniref:GPI mannosyltransferase 1 n=1 Tax=Exserohilum turcicum (strain 28A) TaxID=671987 RepID=R0JVL4_EXST2|nr:glycosyltransferase family 50 protein [Exserohilum turcica Et28A]EOA81529.1 glycosyltransferase family 50 protein [Exserohilum turcica Et28A]